MKLECKLLRSNDVVSVFLSFSLPSTVFSISVILKYLLMENILVVKTIFNISISGQNSVALCRQTLETDCLDLNPAQPNRSHDLRQVT